MKKTILLVLSLIFALGVVALPVNTLFESFDASAEMPVNWNTIVYSGSTTGDVWIQNSEFDAHSGGNFVKMRGDVIELQDVLTLVTPELSQLSNNTLSFYSKSSWGADTDSVRVGTMTDPNDGGTYTEVAAFQLTNVYAQFTVEFDEANTDSYIAIVHKPLGEEDYSMYIDDVSWESVVTAPNPAIVVSPIDNAFNVILDYNDMTMDQNLQWSSNGGNPSSYILNFGTDNPPTNMVENMDLGYVTEYSLDEVLEYGSMYYWQIVPTSDLGDAENCPVWSFATENSALVDFSLTDIYTQGFESAEVGYLPLGVSYTDNNDDGSFWSAIGNSASAQNAHTGDKAAHMRFSFMDPHDDWLFLPAMNMIAGNTYDISFWYNVSAISGSIEKMNVAIGDSPLAASMTTELWDNSAISNTTYAQAEVEYTATETGIKVIGFHCYSDPIQFVLLLDDIVVEQEPGTPNVDYSVVAPSVALSCYPNPFNPETTINYSIPNGTTGSIKVYNMKGQLVKTFNNLSSTAKKVVWNGTNNDENNVPSGIYFYKLTAGQFSTVQKMTLLK